MEMEDVGGKKDYLGGYSECYSSSFCLELVVVLRDLDFLGGSVKITGEDGNNLVVFYSETLEHYIHIYISLIR